MGDDLKARLDADEGDYHTKEILAALEARDKEIERLRAAAIKAGNYAETFRPDYLFAGIIADILEAVLADKEPGDD